MKGLIVGDGLTETFSTLLSRRAQSGSKSRRSKMAKEWKSKSSIKERLR